MVEMELGTCWLPDSIVELVEKHKEMMLFYHSNSENYDILFRADFSMWLSDYLLKYGYKLLQE